MRVWGLSAFLALAINATPAAAQMTDAQKRRAMLPNIKNATDCIAQAALNHVSIVFSYRFNNIDGVLGEVWKQCLPQLEALAAQHDFLHGPGTGVAFVGGPYRGDLQRAVLSRIKGELDRRVAAQDQAEAAQRAEKARVDAERAETIERLTRAARSIRDIFYECSTAQLTKLVRSAETADVLATAAMTICRKELDDAFAAWIAVARADGSLSNEGAFRELLRKATRDSVLTTAVQLKAGGPAPAPPAATRSVSAPPDSNALQECLTNMSKAREGKFIEQKKLLEAMLELCRPEIETLARTAFLKASNADLADERQKALLEASKAARKLIGMPE